MGSAGVDVTRFAESETSSMIEGELREIQAKGTVPVDSADPTFAG